MTLGLAVCIGAGLCNNSQVVCRVELAAAWHVLAVSYQVTDFHLGPQYPQDAMSTYLLHQYVGAASERERLGIHPPMLVGYQILLT